MTDATSVGPDHLRRAAYVYIRQSSMAQVENNTESTRRQYALVDKALALGWPRAAVSVVDDDLGLSGARAAGRSGFAHMASEVAMGRVGIVLCLEVSRLARNNADWYRLLDICAFTRTLIADTDGLYHPGDFNDRLVLGLKGTMSEAELHILRARLDGGIRHKAARGELRRGLPTGFVWGDADGEILFHPDAAVVNAIRTVFARFKETGSARRVWLWFRSNGLLFPLQDTRTMGRNVRWVVPTYHAIHSVLSHPCYAGAYTYGRTRKQRYIDDQGNLRSRSRRLPRNEWAVLIRDHHQGFISTGGPSRKTACASTPTPAPSRVRTSTPRVPGSMARRARRSGKDRRCCRDWLSVVTAAAGCARTIAVATRAQVTIVPARTSSRVAANTVSASAVARSTVRLPRPSWMPFSPLAWKPRLPPPSAWKLTMTLP
jgi:DNA invertase Pin-like site-specific DNA recombinase